MFQDIEKGLKLLESPKTGLKKKLEICKFIEDSLDNIQHNLVSNQDVEVSLETIDFLIAATGEEINNLRDNIDTIESLEKFISIKNKLLACKTYVYTNVSQLEIFVDNNGELENISDKIRDGLLIEEIQKN